MGIDNEELIRKINESPHDGNKVEKIDLSGVILEEEFEKNEEILRRLSEIDFDEDSERTRQ